MVTVPAMALHRYLSKLLTLQCWLAFHRCFTLSCNLQEGNMVCDTEKDHGNEFSSAASHPGDGRWDFARILRQNL